MPEKGDDTEEKDLRKCRRFVYVGHVRPFKGIYDLIDAAERFDSSIEVDVFGPLLDGISEDDFRSCARVKYKGVMPSERVSKTMGTYDAMVLPTRARTEGYPGTVLEAFSAGIPLVATACGGIPEIVDDTCGIVTEPENPDMLFEAMKRLVEDDALYTRLRAGSREKRAEFSSDVWTEEFLRACRNLLE
jgi:glycosyltransferase involved in cell wall biosynthesis